MGGINPIDIFRQPQYTGENRCIPCTIVNVLLAVVGAIVIGIIAAPFEPKSAWILTGVILLILVGIIYSRGYLIPGTPWVTRTYFPEWLLRKFDKNVTIEQETKTENIDVEAFLKGADAVTECAREDDLCLTDEFRTAWRNQITSLREDDTTRKSLAGIFDIDPDQLSFEEFDDAFIAQHNGRRLGQWESHAAFLADMAAATTLRKQHDEWTKLDLGARSSILNGLRIFLNQCPACGSPVTVGEEVVESCCRSIDVVAVSCKKCGARLFEAEQP